jgi:hypothetical protein
MKIATDAVMIGARPPAVLHHPFPAARGYAMEVVERTLDRHLALAMRRSGSCGSDPGLHK